MVVWRKRGGNLVVFCLLGGGRKKRKRGEELFFYELQIGKRGGIRWVHSVFFGEKEGEEERKKKGTRGKFLKNLED